MKLAALALLLVLTRAAAADDSRGGFVKPPDGLVRAATRVAAELSDQFGNETYRRYYQLPRTSHPRGVRAFFVFYGFDGWGGFADCCYRQYIAWFEHVKPLDGDMTKEERVVLMGAVRVGPNADFDRAHPVGASVVFPFKYWAPDDAPSNPTKDGTIDVHIREDVLVVQATRRDGR